MARVHRILERNSGMIIKYEAYDHDLHRWMRPDEVHVDPTGQVWFKNIDSWQKLPPKAIWLTIEKVVIEKTKGSSCWMDDWDGDTANDPGSVTIVSNDHENLKKRI